MRARFALKKMTASKDLNIPICLATEKEKITVLCIHYIPKVIAFAVFHSFRAQ